jgi:hypothetical protein
MQNAIVVLRERPPAAGGGDRFGDVREHARRLPRRIDVGRWQMGRRPAPPPVILSPHDDVDRRDPAQLAGKVA